MNEIGIEGSWLTVNRNCNFRCSWCYAKGTKYNPNDTMTLELAKELIDLKSDIGVKGTCVIGGEPTLWKHLIPIIEYLDAKNMLSSLITNGSLLCNDRFLSPLLESPLNAINLSLKGGNARQFEELTRSNFSEFRKVCLSIGKLSKASINTGVSITVSKLNITNLKEWVETAVDNGAKRVFLEFCCTIFNGNEPNGEYMANPTLIVDYFQENYQAMDEYTSGELYISQSLPACIWPEEFVELLVKRERMSFGCHVMRREGLIFNSVGEIVPCGCLHDFPLGKYGRDFIDADSFVTFWNNPEVVEFYDKFVAYPSNHCIGCEEYNICGGGCPLQWFIYEPDQIIIGRR